MNDTNIDNLTFDLPPIKLSGRASVKELAVTVHAKKTESPAIYEYILRKMREREEKGTEEEGNK